ncbi:hypothetical protein SUGI_0120310 [Cryptomeria japonica]|uniref:transcription factor MYB57 n=1 Tax=Cryptomeria japonica TaxID=3369 RepID=UPI002408ECB5|nr:transcription factor MYB57 [Cryptomeria japonica]GLJ10019.1 hypothetical protein SUGI_0120310 [Cryptomeria japonica]
MYNPQEEQIRKGPWTVEEDMLLVNYIAFHGEGRWNFLAQAAGLKRTGKSCRLRWVNYLRPDLKRGNLSPEEERLIIDLQSRWGNRWSRIARYLPGRTDNEIKNHWRTRIKRKLQRENGGNRFTQYSIYPTSMPDPIFLQQNNGLMKDRTPQTSLHQTLNKPVFHFNEEQKEEFSLDHSNSITISNGVEKSADSCGLLEDMTMPFEVDSFDALFSELYVDAMEVGEMSKFTDCKFGSCSYPHPYPSMPSPDRFQMEALLPWAYQS